MFGSSRIQPTYSASTVLRILTPTIGSIDRVEYDTRYADRLMSTYTEIVTSQPVIDELMLTLNLDTEPKIGVTVLANTELMEISAESSDPEQARDIANTLAEMLITQSQELYLGGGRSAAQILAEQLVQAEDELNDARYEYEQMLLDPSVSPERLELAQSSIVLKESVYASMLDQYEQSRVSESMRTNLISVVEPAVVPESPARPQKILIIGLGGLLGLVGGIGLAILFENLDSRLYSVEQVETILQLPILGQVPSINKQRARRLLNGDSYQTEAFHRLRTGIFAPYSGQDHLTSIKGIGSVYERELHKAGIYTFRQLAATSSDQLQTKLATVNGRNVNADDWIEQAQKLIVHEDADTALRTLLVTSAIPAEGKSTIVANLAATVGKSGRTVLAIDADLLLPTLHKIFELPNEIGLSNVLAGDVSLEEAIQETSAPGVWLLTSGLKTINRTELLESPSMRTILDDAARKFDVVIIDSPALLAVTDGVILASAVDGVVVVVRRAQTHEPALKAALQLLTAVNPKLIGVVVNRVKQNANYQYYRYYHRNMDQHKN